MDTANAILSLFLPLIVSFFKQSGFDDRVNRAIALVIYLVWAAIVTVALGDFTIQGLLANFATTLVAGTIAYQMIWKAFGIDDTLTNVTSFRKAPEEDVIVTG